MFMKRKIFEFELYELGKGIYIGRTTPELRNQPFPHETEEIFNHMTDEYPNFEADLNNAVTDEVMNEYKYVSRLYEKDFETSTEFLNKKNRIETEIINLLSKSMYRYLQK